MKSIGAALAAAFLVGISIPAYAQTAPPYTLPTLNYNATSGTGGTSALLPRPIEGTSSYALFRNKGTVDISYALGNTSSITVATGSTIPTIPAGGCEIIFVGPITKSSGGYIAVVSASAATLEVSLQYGGGPLPASCPGPSGGGAGGAVTQGTVPWVEQSQQITPATGTTATIVTGGTAVTLATGPINGGYVINPANAASQGIVTAENAYVDPVATPGSTDAAANGTTALLQAGQSFYLPPLVTGVLVKGNAGTSGHKLTVVTW